MNKSKIHLGIVKLCCVCLLLLSPNIAFGLAGLAEDSFDLYYTDDILLQFHAPSDTCPFVENVKPHQYCFELHSVEPGEYGIKEDKNIETLVEINIPKSEPKFIIGKSYKQGIWLIYDVKKDEVVFANQDLNLALAEWEKLGNEEPEFVNVNDVLDHFEETSESKKFHKKENWIFGLIGLMGILTIVGVPVMVVALMFLAIYSIHYLLNKKRGNDLGKFMNKNVSVAIWIIFGIVAAAMLVVILFADFIY